MQGPVWLLVPLFPLSPGSCLCPVLRAQWTQLPGGGVSASLADQPPTLWLDLPLWVFL